ncbi:hypothetical protein DXG01_002543 [Tephrocybe rancida]|nr:hypothetical protein DXG01_002543 [Tephrocybe rancida]
MLTNILSEFIADAKTTGRDLQWFSSRMSGAVDRIMAFSDYALRTIEILDSKSVGSLLRNRDWTRSDAVVGAFIQITALAPVVGVLQSLKALNSDMEVMREHVAAPDLTGSRIPIEVHMRNIKAGFQRLQERKVHIGKQLDRTRIESGRT